MEFLSFRARPNGKRRLSGMELTSDPPLLDDLSPAFGAAPAAGKALPADGKALPEEGKAFPADGKALPTAEEEFPAAMA